MGRMLRGGAADCKSAEFLKVSSILTLPTKFRAEDERVIRKPPLPSQCLLVPFTVRTKEPADVFPRRARLGPPCDIPDFASAPVGVARRILV